MKKLMKAIAFATVMCMLLSTAAFAAVNPVVSDYAAKTLSITITGNGASEQVSLLILKKDANLNSLAPADILYIDQTAADGSGRATFAATLNTSETAVDIYSGNETYAAGASGAATAYQLLGDVSLVAPVTNVTVVTQESGLVKGTDGVGLYATVDFTAVPAGYTLSKMVWALEKTVGGFLYTNSVDLADYGYVAIAAQSGLKFAANIPNSVFDADQNFTGKADAIFLFVNTAGDQKEVYSGNQDHSGAKEN